MKQLYKQDGGRKERKNGHSVGKKMTSHINACQCGIKGLVLLAFVKKSNIYKIYLTSGLTGGSFLSSGNGGGAEL